MRISSDNPLDRPDGTSYEESYDQPDIFLFSGGQDPLTPHPRSSPLSYGVQSEFVQDEAYHEPVEEEPYLPGLADDVIALYTSPEVDIFHSQC
jgi:hypothetical protein